METTSTTLGGGLPFSVIIVGRKKAFVEEAMSPCFFVLLVLFLFIASLVGQSYTLLEAPSSWLLLVTYKREIRFF